MSRSNYHVRIATKEDLPVLYQFEQGVVAAERPFDETLKEGEIHYYNLQWLIESPDAKLLVVTAGEQIIASGYARIEQAKAFLQYQQYAYLGFMYVVPEYRGKQIIQLILSGLSKWVAAKNVFELRLDVYSENIAAIKAYEKMGFTKLLIEMRKHITAGT